MRYNERLNLKGVYIMILTIVKAGIGMVTSIGVGSIVGNAIKATTPVGMKKYTKVCVSLGSLVLTALAGDMASKYVESEIDSVVDTVKGINYEETDQIVEQEEA